MNGMELLRSLYNGCAIVLFGMLLLQWSMPANARASLPRMTMAGTLLALGCVLASAGCIAAKALELNGVSGSMLDVDGWRAVLATRFGTVWSGRLLLALPIVLLAARASLPSRFAASLFAGIALAIGPLAGHAAGLEPAWPTLSAHALHLLAAGAWVGALPALAILLYAARGEGDPLRDDAIVTLKRFSVLATAMVATVTISGFAMAQVLLIGMPSLVALRVEWLDLLRIALFTPVVALAWHLRWRWFPLPHTGHEASPGRAPGTSARERGGPRWLLVAALSLVALIALRIAQDWAAPLLGTGYGRTVLAKIALLAAVCVLAARVRWVLMPAMPGDTNRANRTDRADRADAARKTSAAGRSVALECLLGLAIVLLGSLAAETTPAAHTQIQWPLRWRLSIDATWVDPAVRIRVLAGVALLLAAIAWGAFEWLRAAAKASALSVARRDAESAAQLPARRPEQPQMRALTARWPLRGCALLIAAGLAVALPPLAVESYPDTFRRSAVPYEAASIANGIALYRAHCVGCHGSSGRGDGPQAKSLALPPANLTEPHTALHTGGDMFWWLTHGMRDKPMPGFAQVLSEDERWDLINFLRALSTGYQGRILGDLVVPERPWLGAPDFVFTMTGAGNRRLKDLRGKHSVLLVFFSWPQSRERLQSLRAQSALLTLAGVQVLAVPANEEAALSVDRAMQQHFGFVIDPAGSADIAASYALMARTLEKAGDDAGGVAVPHMELLIDRFGYIRARSISESEEEPWPQLPAQIDRLQRERQILPPPDDHVH